MKKFNFCLLGVLFLLTFSVSFAGTKPLDGLRDYNGTYKESPGTGTIEYRSGINTGTLYRDNEDFGSVSGCNGEGCGSHGGVDIPIISGTLVKASFAGEVVKAECETNLGWGGLVVIKSISPYNSSEIIYTSYAHLRNWSYYSVGNQVVEGSVIGESGGGAGDVCSGTSGGAHLHFQIDKNHAFYKPWYPQLINRTYNTPDSDFKVTEYTYNPIVFVVGGYNWTFADQGNSEYWTDLNTSYSGIESDIYWIDGNYDPYIWRNGDVNGYVNCEPELTTLTKPCSAQITADANIYKWVMVNIQNFCITNPMKVYYKTSLDDTWSEIKSNSFDYTSPANYWFYMGNDPNWVGIIKNIRIDPAVNCDPASFDPNYFYQITLQR